MSNNGSELASRTDKEKVCAGSEKSGECRKPLNDVSECPFGAFIISLDAADRFLQDYFQRHRHPLNAVLHIFGVPAAFLGFWKILVERKVGSGGALVFVGYLLQYLGHRAQGNEVGEVTLAKSIYRKLKSGK